MVYVDSVAFYPQKMVSIAAKKYRSRWSHMFADDIEELHKFARAIGLRRSYFQDKPGFPHYDVTPINRNMAILRGAEIKQTITFLREKRNATTKN